MQKVATGYFKKSLTNISNQSANLILSELFLLFKELREVPLVAEFGDNVAVVGCGENIVTLQDIGMADSFEGLYFAVEHLPSEIIFDCFDVYDFDCDCLS